MLWWRNRRDDNSLEAQEEQEMRKPLTNADVTDGPSVKSAIIKIDNLIQTHELDENRPWVELKEEISEKMNPKNNGNNNVH